MAEPSKVVRSREALEELYGVTDDELAELRDWIETAGYPSALTKTLMRHLDADIVVFAWCDHCSKSVKVRYPNYQGFLAVVKLLSEYKLQKMSERRELNVNVTHRNVIEMSPEERQAYKQQLLARLPRKELPPGPSAA